MHGKKRKGFSNDERQEKTQKKQETVVLRAYNKYGVNTFRWDDERLVAPATLHLHDVPHARHSIGVLGLEVDPGNEAGVHDDAAQRREAQRVR